MTQSDYHTYAPAGYCIYCGTTEGKLTKEHIIPYSLNGKWVLPKSSCIACAKKTQKMEEVCTSDRGGMFYPLRVLLGLPSRRKSTRTSIVSAELLSPDGSTSWHPVPIEDYPAIAWGVQLPVAGILLGHPPDKPAEYSLDSKILSRTQSLSVVGAIRIGRFHESEFFQLIAKIGYSYAAAEIGTSSLMPMVADLLLGHSAIGPHLVGGGWLNSESALVNRGHKLELHECTIGASRFTIAQIHLFGQFGLPAYHVVVGQRNLDC